MYPTKDSMKKLGAGIALVSIWVISFLMASPASLFSKLHTEEFPNVQPSTFCVEDKSLNVERQAYSVATLVVQYVLPFIILIVAHLRICNKLRYRMVTTQNLPATATTTAYQRKKNERRKRRKRKTNFLLAGIAIVFALSWLPLNLINLILDFNQEFFLEHEVDTLLPVGICHLIVLCSACLNPVMYGWLNDNFRVEFEKILCCSCCGILGAKLRRVCCCSRQPVGVPAITLTKVGNGHSVTLDEGLGRDATTSLTVQYQGIVS